MAAKAIACGTLTRATASRERASLEEALPVLAPLLAHDPATYWHCLRVGVLSGRLASFVGADASLALLAGSLHDIGKLDVPVEVLRASSFGPAERRIVQRHVATGFLRLSALGYTEAAYVAGLHHAFQPNHYYSLDPRRCDAGVRLVARIVAVCDYCDAFLSRHDSHPHRNDAGRRSPADAIAHAYPRWATCSERLASWGKDLLFGDVAS